MDKKLLDSGLLRAGIWTGLVMLVCSGTTHASTHLDATGSLSAMRYQTVQGDTKGVVTDSLGSTLAGATIRVKNTSITATTDREGQFSLEDLPDGSVLVANYIGYKPVEVPVTHRFLRIGLESADHQLEEVVVEIGKASCRERVCPYV